MTILKIYDGLADEYREPTQADIDRLVSAQRSLGLHRQILRKIVEAKPMVDGSFDEHFRILQKMADVE